MGWFGEDIFKTITRQFDRDKEKKARQTAAARANPDVARRISQYRAKYPHLTAGAALAPAQAGLDVDDPALERLAMKTAQRKVKKGKGWLSIGQISDVLNIDESMDFIGKSLGVANDALQAGVRTAVVVGESGGQMIGGAYRRHVREGNNNPLEVLQDTLTKGIFPKEVVEDTTIGIAVNRLKNPEEARRADLTLNPQDPSPGGAGIGQGFLPRGPAVEEQARRARETAFIEYADQPIFSVLGKREDQASRHALTPGRGLFKDVLEPGTLPFNFLSGIVDAGVSIVSDPTAIVGKGVGAVRAGRKVFTAEDAGRTVGHADRVAAAGKAAPDAKSPTDTATDLFTSANEDPELAGKTLKQINEILDARKATQEAEMGMIRSHRNTIHPPTTQNWLTVSAPGRKFTQWVVDNDDPYTIYKTLNAEKNNIPVALINNMAATTNTDEALALISSELGVGLSTKPITSRFQPVGGYMGEVKNSLLSNRILNAMPHQVAHIADPDTSAAQLVRLMRGASLPEHKIGPRFNEIAAAASKEERATIFNNAEADIYEHILEDITGPLTIRGKDTRKRLNGLWANNTEVLNTVLRRQISSKTAPESLDVDGIPAPIRNIYEEAEYVDDVYQLPDARAMRRLVTQYGRLLNNPVLDAPVALIDHMSSVWKTFAIARPALTLRVVGEEQVRMAGAGYRSVINHPLSAISWAIGTNKKYLPGITPKGQLDVLGNQFNAADELTHFSRSQARSSSEWKDRIRTENKRVTPFTDPEFVSAWSDDIFKFRQDEIARRIASGEDYADIKTWLKSDAEDARSYRALAEDDLSIDKADGYVENISNLIKAKTYGNQTLLEAISTGRYKGKDIFNVSDQGARSLNPAFKKQLTKLVDEDISPEHSIGDMTPPRTSKSVKETRDNVTERVFNTLLSRPSNWLSRSPTFRQAYWKNVETGIMHASPDTQTAIINAAREANMGKDVVNSLTAISKKASGDLSLDELDIYAKGHALKAEEQLLYDLSNRNQLLDAMRLVFPFGEAWKEVLGSWARITAANPAVIPRAGMTVNGARSSGFFFEDPVSGEEKFVFPGTQFINRSLMKVDAPFQASASSLNMFSNNPLLPGFGPIPQVAVGRLFPDKPDNEFIRGMVLPYGEPGSPLPSWAQKAWAGFSESDTNKLYADSVADAARYLHSTGRYDMDNDADQQELEIEARKMGKRLLLFRALGQAVLPAAPSYQDVAKDTNGHTVLAFTLTDRYRQLLKEDDDKNTNDAAQRFISEFGEKNLLYMQSFSKGGEVFSKAGHDWVRENPEIVSRYPEIYGLIAPNDGGFDIKAYHALFENGVRKPLPVKEALKAGNQRAGKMVLRNITSKMPPPSKRTPEQRVWLNDVKKKLVERFPGYDPTFKGSTVPDRIARLSRAVEDPLLADQPVVPAIRAYLSARAQVEALAAQKGIVGWQTAKKMKAQRRWLLEAADKITRQQPAFLNVYDDLFDHELTDEEGI